MRVQIAILSVAILFFAVPGLLDAQVIIAPTSGGGSTGGSGSGGSTTGGTTTGGTTTGGGALPGYTDDFEAGNNGWTFSSSGTVAWAIDGTPASVPGGPASSGSFSLNYNNGINYDDGLANSGSAVSPQIDVSGMTFPALSFMTNYQTEPGTLARDQRWVEISNDGFSSLVWSAQLPDTGAMGSWQSHVINLDPSWGIIEIRFRFDSVDAVQNNFAGWFVDDLDVSDTGAGGIGTTTGGTTTTGGSTTGVTPPAVGGNSSDDEDGFLCSAGFETQCADQPFLPFLLAGLVLILLISRRR